MDHVLRDTKLTLALKLGPSADQHAVLPLTMVHFNQACNWIAEFALREPTANKIRLQRLISGAIRARSGLSAQRAIRAISRVCQAYQRDRSSIPASVRTERCPPTRGSCPGRRRIMSAC